MTPIRQRIVVPFGYEVHFTTGLFRVGNPLLESVVRGAEEDAARKILCVMDGGLAAANPGLAQSIVEYCAFHGLALAGAPMVVAGGEAVKNSREHLDRVHAAIHEFGICRHSFVLAVGGGALLDMAGYAAATAHRGVRLIRVPTTVLAQNDSGVGVKNGINAFGKKNFLGVFAPPYAVLNDLELLETLGDRDWRAGTAEAVKVALIKDAGFFEFLEEQAEALAGRDRGAMQRLVERCAAMHVAHIQSSGDPFEAGTSRPLDFGHWAAHKLEQLTGFEMRHGEAVARGIALDTTYSYRSGLLPEADWRRTLGLLTALGFELSIPEPCAPLRRDNPRCLLSGLNEFREHLGGQLTIMLLKRVGESVEVHEISNDLVLESIGVLNEAAQGARTNL